MNVLSLFDGMSCGQIALDRAGIKVDKYFASEIDKYAMQISKKNFPDIIQIGDVSELKGESLPEISLLIGGSPCQGFSSAGNRLAFDDPRSKLFFEFIRLMKEIQPKYFLLENVKMKQEWVDIISDYIGVEAIEFNSKLVSAQNRRRLYWTNIPFGRHEDKGITIHDVLEKEVDESFYFKRERIEHIFDRHFEEPYLKERLYNGQSELVQLVGDLHKPGISRSSLREDKAWTLCANPKSDRYQIVKEYEDGKYRFRKLTPTEAEKLQTVPVGYTEGVSNTQRNKMIGNGWTVDVVSHIFKGLK